MNLGGQLRPPSRRFSVDLAQVRRSQARLADLKAETYCFGHGLLLHHGGPALRRLAEEN
jgi:hypothetical protein